MNFKNFAIGKILKSDSLRSGIVAMIEKQVIKKMANYTFAEIEIIGGKMSVFLARYEGPDFKAIRIEPSVFLSIGDIPGLNILDLIKTKLGGMGNDYTLRFENTNEGVIVEIEENGKQVVYEGLKPLLNRLIMENADDITGFAKELPQPPEDHYPTLPESELQETPDPEGHPYGAGQYPGPNQ